MYKRILNKRLEAKKVDGRKINVYFKPILDKNRCIKEFTDITVDDNIYIPTEFTNQIFNVFLKKKDIEVNFVVYIYNFIVKDIEIYECNYIYMHKI